MMRPSETFLGQPIRSLQTMLRVLEKNPEEDPRLIPDGIYGPETTSAVSRFQQDHGLPITGVTNQETWDSIASEFEDAMVDHAAATPVSILMNPGCVYHKGDHNPNLLLAQAMLMTLSQVCQSIGTPAMSGVLDEATADALSSFQQVCGLPMTGQLDKMTWKNLALQYPLASTLATD